MVKNPSGYLSLTGRDSSPQASVIFNTILNQHLNRFSMSERKRSRFSNLFRGRRANAEKLNEVLNPDVRPQLEWDGKTLASMSKIGNATKNSGYSISSANPSVSYKLVRDISLKNEVVNAIIRRTVDDTLGNGYHFALADGKEQGSPEQLEKLKSFFKSPNPDDNGDEWLESLIYDLQLFGDAYLELDGSEDEATNTDGTHWTYGGELVSIWNIPAETMTLVPANRRPKPPKMAYVQKIDGKERQFSADKVLHVSKFKQGRSYGTSPVIPLLNVIAGHLNLSNYLNELYTGTLPKTILNVGDISNGEMKAMLALLEQQLAGGKSPFGLVAVNGGTGFNMHRLLDSAAEGKQLDLIHYYREEICAVFGIPPMKLGWVQTGKMSNPEQQLDAWYDVIESFHNRIESLINNRILPLMEITDWEFRFTTIRPRRDNEIAETRKNQATAISSLRQESVISINEARNMLGLEKLEVANADDPFFLSPKLSINQGKQENSATKNPVPSLSDIFPAATAPSGEGKDAGTLPNFVEPVPDIELNNEITSKLRTRRAKRNDEYESMISSASVEMDATLDAEQARFADAIVNSLDEMFADGDEAVELPNVELSVEGWIRKRTISLAEIQSAILTVDSEIANTIERQAINAQAILTDTYGESLTLTLTGTGIGAALNADDLAALSYWRGRWVLPSLRNTLGSHREAIIGVFEQMVAEGESWRWAKNEMRSLIDPSGSRYPAYYYERVGSHRNKTSRGECSHFRNEKGWI